MQAFYSVRSERQLMQQLGYNLSFRWFVGLSMDAQSFRPKDEAGGGRNAEREAASSMLGPQRGLTASFYNHEGGNKARDGRISASC